MRLKSDSGPEQKRDDKKPAPHNQEAGKYHFLEIPRKANQHTIVFNLIILPQFIGDKD